MERGIALDSAKHDIASRLRRVCEHYAEDEFAELVGRMAEIDVRYRMRDEWVHYIEPGKTRPHAMN